MVPSFFDISFTSAFTSAVERASSFASVAFLSPFSFFTSTSVAITFAPSVTNASAIARPIPCPAAVTSATLPFSLPAKPASRCFSKPLYQMHRHPVTHVLRAFMRVTMARVPGDVEGERLAGVKADAGAAEFAGSRLGEREHPIADATGLRCGRARDTPDQQIVGARLEDQHALERPFALRQIDLVIGKD